METLWLPSSGNGKMLRHTLLDSSSHGIALRRSFHEIILKQSAVQAETEEDFLRRCCMEARP